MEIRVGSLLRDAREATGAAIIIDVFRAFTTAAIAFDHGAKDITLVAEVEEALALRERGIGDVLMGEEHPEGFDYGNSPYEVSQVDFTGKSIVQSTRAGTVGVAAAANADTIYLGSLAVAQATVQAVVGRRRCRRLWPTARRSSPLLQWGTGEGCGPTRTSTVPCTCATCWKAGSRTRTRCGRWYGPAATP